MTADDILNALIAISADKIWCVELPFRGSATRIDFWTLAPTKSRGFRTCAYEIKVSRSDFNRDSYAKQLGALNYSDRFWYVCPDGILKKSDIPDWAGLMTFDGKAFSVVKKPPMREKLEPDWGVVVDVLRNSGQCRRDVDMMAGQLAFLQHRLKRIEEGVRVQDRVRTERLLRKFQPKILKIPTTQEED